MNLTLAQMLLLEIVDRAGFDGVAAQQKAPHAYVGTPPRRVMPKAKRAAKRRLALRLFKGHRP